MTRPSQTHHTIATKLFVEEISGCTTPSVLDLGCICDTNVEFLVHAGCKVFVDDLLDFNVRIPKKTQEIAIDKFLAEIDYTENFFDGILCWDIFDHLEAQNAKTLVSKLRKFIKKNGMIFTLFRPESIASSANHNVIRYGIVSLEELNYEPLPLPSVRPQIYHNRDILALFENFSFSNSYILTNGWREVIVRK